MSASIGIFYGSTTGNTAEVAELIAEQFAVPCDLHDLAESPLSLVSEYEKVILGISTWDFGELQEDWDEQWGEIAGLSLKGKTIALFGLGDQLGYGEWFVDAMGLLHEQLIKKGAVLVGQWPNQGYNFEASKGLTQDQQYFVGLALDQDTQRSETDERVEQWVRLIQPYF
ncbi:MAG: flavodoxin [Pontibacterium sp.]